MNELYNKLELYFNFDKKDLVIQSLFKSIVLLFGGALLGALITDFEISKATFMILLLFLFLLTIYIYLEYKFLINQKNFPISILEHLTAKEDLEVLTKHHNRQKKVFEFIDHSIMSLNTNTCPVSYDAIDDAICREDLKESLSNILNDFINRTNYFLEVDKLNFTNGVYLNDILTFTENIPSESVQNFNFKDDLNFSKYFGDFEYDFNSKEKEFKFHLISAISESILFSKYICKQLRLNDKDYSIVISPIPNICDSCPPRGVIYAIYEGTENCNCDSNKILEIHCRLLTNWISKYEDCLYNDKLKELGNSVQKSNSEHQHKKTNITENPEN
ncbi:hypothetical protein [Flavobacterium sp. F52]|uniref:hypothetical protein n=1 Tax=Flavobacterium sp. F52 TaxID=1202532 RepID=UPI000272E3E8|nr:hypothetical protein [Flavobacterium sp. F52]EJG01073.1 hypothetical protein FF52_12461 [Flavobacterium sp. F52]